MRLTKILPPMLAVLLLGFGGWHLSRYIASKHRAFQGREFAQAHPLLQWLGPSQSATQGGYTLLAVQDAAQPFQYQEAHGGGNSSYQYQSSGDTSLMGDTAFWLLLDNPPAGMPSYASSRSTSNANFFTVTAHSSSGDTFPLDWELNASQPGPFLHITLPAGYPDTYYWVDLTVDEHHGQKTTWRINHLPPTQHLIPPPVRVQNTYTNGGVTLTACAWRQRDPYNKPHAMLAMDHVSGTIRPYQHQWEVAFLGCQWEWGVPNAPQQNGIMSEGFSDKGVFNNGEDVVGNGYTGMAHPYLSHNHYICLSCELRQFETYGETMTFHNVRLRKDNAGAWRFAPAQALSLTTPSGITVTLPDVSSVKLFDAGFGRDGIWYQIASEPPRAALSLPHSPLWQKYHKPVDISVFPKLPPGYEEGGGEMT